MITGVKFKFKPSGYDSKWLPYILMHSGSPNMHVFFDAHSSLLTFSFFNWVQSLWWTDRQTDRQTNLVILAKSHSGASVSALKPSPNFVRNISKAIKMLIKGSLSNFLLPYPAFCGQKWQFISKQIQNTMTIKTEDLALKGWYHIEVILHNFGSLTQ